MWRLKSITSIHRFYRFIDFIIPQHALLTDENELQNDIQSFIFHK